MKKHLARYICAGVAAAVFATTACALTLGGTGGSLSKDVYVSKEELSEPETVYYVDVAWGDMEFVYNAGTKKLEWDPLTHSYKESIITAENAWSCADGANKVTVTNRSNTSILATVTVQMNDGYGDITASVNGGSISLTDASEGASLTEAGRASFGNATVTLSGELKNTNANKTEIGQVKVTISDLE